MFDIERINWEGLLTSASILILKLAAITIAFLIVKAIGKKIIERSFQRLMERDNVTRGRALTLKSLTFNLFSYVLVFIFVVMLFETVGVKATALLAGAGVVGLAIGFGAQGLVSDVVTGFFLLLEKQIDVDDYVTTGSFSGIVEAVGLRTTHIRGFDGTLHYVPNREITSLSNHSRGNMRALVDIGISYDDDIDKAITVLQDVCNRIAQEEEAVVDGPNVIGVQSLGSSDVVLRVVGKTQNGEQWAVERKLRKALKEALDANGIEIPFPHQVYVEKKQPGEGNNQPQLDS
ncbi:mechanosensitive ion channel family protein [Metabacillus iocasae]|uniref:Small conductance mechanosensitive channel n=1 Tax=Priestia iocasae TaxID=2291674 RepID=A0ABS2QXC3_9BACI|nr:mechanosensitive ion channel family protein [Metabacillus iocasae]MBM7703396.1 small conductance mechanosensitive channel [Metabacillus iocasae]